MRTASLLFFFCLCPAAALAGGATSAYTSFDLEKTCRLIERDEETGSYASWSCPGHGDMGVRQSVSDDRGFVGFGPSPESTCAYRKTFTPFNTPLSPIEWRLRGGRAFAAIERWRVVTGDDGNSVTWLVVTKLDGNEACHIHYVAGSFPKANEEARRAADSYAGGFDCETDTPRVSTTSLPPPIDLASCRDLAAE